MSTEGTEGQTDPELTVVMPFYNPGPDLPRNVAEVVDALERTGISFEVLVVNDGSTDGSAEALASVLDERVQRIDLPAHAGKGEALRVGLSRGRGRVRGFIDADGDIPGDELRPLVRAIATGTTDVVIGSKRQAGSDVVNPPLRRLYSWGFQALVRLLFQLRVLDTQTGIKLFRREVLDAALPLTREKRYALDLELLVLARLHGFNRVEELPVTIRRRVGSTISLRAVGGIMADMLAVWWRLRVLRRYRSTH